MCVLFAGGVGYLVLQAVGVEALGLEFWMKA